MIRPRALDLFCGAGGAGMGLHLAGFDVVGVDIAPQPRYPFEFHQADAMTFPLDGFDFVWASPPCQGYSLARNNGSGRDAPLLVGAVRGRLLESGIPWAIENVPGAPLRFPIILCGATFGLGIGDEFDLSRHRLFETSRLLLAPPCQHRRGKTIGVYGNGMNSWHREKVGRYVSADEQRKIMGIDWMTSAELTQAIPPAYGRWIGEQMMPLVMRGKAVCA